METVSKPVVIKTFGVFECIGHSTSSSLAMTVAAMACPSWCDGGMRVLDRTVRVDGSHRSAFLVERQT